MTLNLDTDDLDAGGMVFSGLRCAGSADRWYGIAHCLSGARPRWDCEATAPAGNEEQMSKRTRARSAGLLMYRGTGADLAVLLVHPGGPFWARRDLGAWSIPKGEYAPDEDPLGAARREFAEETGARPHGPFRALGEVVQAGGKHVVAWAVEGEFDPATLVSGSFELEWPPRSGRRRSFPEVDRAAWFSPAQARRKILAGQRPFIDRLERSLGTPPGGVPRDASRQAPGERE
jgi:predicted NUDIX family NTP pyrophosphohydrolase